MTSRLRALLFLRPVVLLFLSAAAVPAESAFGAKATMEVMTVAERTPEGDALVKRAADKPIRCLLLQGIFIQPNPYRANVHWDPPPSETVTRALEIALKARSYVSAETADAPPDVVITYHWGVTFGLPSLWLPTERLGYGAPLSSGFSTNMRAGRLPGASVSGPRAFLVVTAYDYAALNKNLIQPLWRTKLSATTLEGSLTRIIPSLALTGAKHFGAAYPLREWETVWLEDAVPPAASVEEGIAQVRTGRVYAPEEKSLDSRALYDLLRHEVLELGGQHPTRDVWRMQGMALQSSLPKKLSKMIADYERDRSKLEQALRAALKGAPSPEARRQITTEFLQQKAKIIANLDGRRDRIHRELAGLAAAGETPKTIEALLEEFSTSRRQLSALDSAAVP